MAPVKFDRIVSVSSEDPAFPAENLLKNSYSDKKWKSKEPGEKQISVVIQMEKAEKIGAIDVGNYGSAFIEILVCKSSTPDDFKVLVVASSLMTLQEAKLGNNITNVRFFKEDSLVKEVASEKWDRVKIICSQPYNKHIQYGLAFIVIHSLNTSVSALCSPTLGKFQLKEKDDSGGLSVGSLFAKRKESGPTELKGAAAIRAASTSGIIEKKNSPLSVATGTSNTPTSKLTIPDDESVMQNEISELRKKTPQRSKDKTPKVKPKGGTGESSTSGATRTPKANKRTAEEIKENVRKRVPAKPRLEKPFNQLFEGVVFTISGFQNPYRSEIRNKALAMGAKYRPDWDNTCTHLLCAFPNTPKFNQVLGQGKIIKKEWIETCYNRRIRLPWRRFALHPPDKDAPESEDEIFEKVARPPSPVDNRRRISPGRSSGEDTEEEIERILLIQAKEQTVNSSDTVNGDRASSIDESLPKVAGPIEGKESPILQDKPKPLITEKTVKNNEQLRIKTNNVLESEEEDSVLEKEAASRLGHNETPKKKKKPKQKESPVLPKPSHTGESIKNGKLEIEKDECNISRNKSPKGKNKSKEKYSQKLKKILDSPETVKVSNAKKSDKPEETYHMDTEEEDDSSDSKKWNLPHLPAFFDGIKFYVADDLSDHLQKQLRRYIFAHKGCLVEEDDLLFEEVQYVITESKEQVQKVKENCTNAIGLRPEWIWKAHDEGRCPPTLSFEISS